MTLYANSYVLTAGLIRIRKKHNETGASGGERRQLSCEKLVNKAHVCIKIDSIRFSTKQKTGNCFRDFDATINRLQDEGRVKGSPRTDFISRGRYSESFLRCYYDVRREAELRNEIPRLSSLRMRYPKNRIMYIHTYMQREDDIGYKAPGARDIRMFFRHNFVEY